MDVAVLRSRLDGLEAIPDEQWMRGLSERKLKELAFHDRDRDVDFEKAAKAQDTYEKFYGNRKFYSATRRSSTYIDEWVAKNAPDNVFLDYACGKAGTARKAAHMGAALAIGLDISRVSVQRAAQVAAAEGLSANTRFIQADAEDTKLPDQSIDRVFCSGMLHHLDLSYAFPELRRIVKPGGRILAVEALDYNPAIKLYRYLTPAMRTEWERAHILSLRDVRFAERFFDVSSIRFWHVVGYLGALAPIMLPALDGLDRLLERIPGLQLMAWTFTFELVRRNE